MKKTALRKEYNTIDRYEVSNYENYTDDEIINFCDPNNFGGFVHRYHDNAIVEVYID